MTGHVAEKNVGNRTRTRTRTRTRWVDGLTVVGAPRPPRFLHTLSDLDFFIAHAGADAASARALHDALVALGRRVFFDGASLRPGDRWDRAVPDALRRAHTTVVLVPAAPSAGYYDHEEIAAAIHHARHDGQRVVPLYLKGTSPPDDVPYGLRRLVPLYLEVCGSWSRVAAALVTVGAATGSTAPDARSAPRPRALIAEDVAAHREVLCDVVTDLGLDPTAVADYSSAVAALRSGRFAVVLLDMQLDPMDTTGQQGVQLVEQVRSLQRGAVVVIVSALPWSGAQVRDFLKEHGIHDFVPKPFSPARLRKILEAGLERA